MLKSLIEYIRHDIFKVKRPDRRFSKRKEFVIRITPRLIEKIFEVMHVDDPELYIKQAIALMNYIVEVLSNDDFVFAIVNPNTKTPPRALVFPLVLKNKAPDGWRAHSVGESGEIATVESSLQIESKISSTDDKDLTPGQILEREFWIAILKLHNFSRRAVARDIGMNAYTVIKRMRLYNVEAPKPSGDDHARGV